MRYPRSSGKGGLGGPGYVAPKRTFIGLPAASCISTLSNKEMSESVRSTRWTR
jgi:hypothetical protein